MRKRRQGAVEDASRRLLGASAPLEGNGVWSLLRPASEYVHANDDDRAFEESYRGMGRTFPHPLEKTPGDHLRTVKRTPFGDELTLELVRALFDAEPLGRDEVPDFLAISFSATDYVSHHFGPESLEAEDNSLRLDRTLAGLFEALTTSRITVRLKPRRAP